ncbi:glycoside hydrolase family 130 protein [Pseudochryseolinea flava]|uniref:Glycosidase n=1 Tax=Pseudochryseolinea flava TaxID=2059302 RepID=A0A364Y6J3_9BACT|nr:glycoside hydrolase family 130 protein [Pseudochryseolinea flava]RAW02027.1 glycosidase [Pseudochryseolinea flava]
MKNVFTRDIAVRFEENPLLTPSDIKPSSKNLVVVGLMNPAVFRFNKKTWLLVRVAQRPHQQHGFITFPVSMDNGEIETLTYPNSDPKLDLSDPRKIRYDGRDYLTTHSYLKLMCSDEGREFYEPENYVPIFGSSELESYGIEDCRVTEIDEIYYLTYTMVSAYGVGVGLMKTRDWKRFERKGMILPPHNKDCAIFELKFRDRYYALHRPSSTEFGGNYIWLAESPDAVHWGNHQCIATTRENMWDSARIGAGCSPVKTPKGWLIIYHGADASNRYCLGAILLSIHEPWIVIGRSSSPLMEPTEEYELKGFFGNVIFTNGHLVVGDKLHLYYGASDEVICGADLSIQEILDSLDLENK